MTYIRYKMVKGNGPYAYEEEKVKTSDGWKTRHVRYLGKTTPGMPVQTGVPTERPDEIPEQRPITDEPGPTENEESIDEIGKMPSDVSEQLEKEEEEKWGIDQFKKDAEEVTGKMPRDLDEEEEKPGEGIDEIGKMPKDVSEQLQKEEETKWGWDTLTEEDEQKPKEEETKWGIDRFKEMAEEGYTPDTEEEPPEPEDEQPEPEEGGGEGVRGLVEKAKEGVGAKMPSGEIPSLELRERYERGRIKIKDEKKRIPVPEEEDKPLLEQEGDSTPEEVGMELRKGKMPQQSYTEEEEDNEEETDEFGQPEREEEEE